MMTSTIVPRAGGGRMPPPFPPNAADAAQPASDGRRQSLATLDRGLQVEADLMLRRWGDTGWRSLVAGVKPLDDPVLRGLVHAVAGIEDDAFYMQVKLNSAGVLRSPAVQAFNSIWLTEETDHGRAFAELAMKLDGSGVESPTTAHATLARDRRAIAALPVIRLCGTYRRATLGGYLVRGLMVEHVAIAFYGSLMHQLALADEQAGAEIVRRVLRQEGRHLRFFTRGAKLVLSSSPFAARVVRRATERSWRPPGVDLYGPKRWKALFAPVLSDSRAMQELLRVDEKVSRVPGFEGSTIVADYLAGL